MPAEKIRLNDADFELLLPGKDITLGTSIITIRPLGLAALKDVFQKLDVIKADLTSHEITFENYSELDKLITLAILLLDVSPDILSDATNIHVDDLNRLPLAPVTTILNEVLDINIASQEGLVKNFEDLAEKIQTLQGGQPMSEKEPSGKLSKDLLAKVTHGKKSKRTRLGK